MKVMSLLNIMEYQKIRPNPQITITSDLTISADFKKIKQHVSAPYVDGKKVIAFYAGNKKILKIYQGTTFGTGTSIAYKQLY